MGAVPLDLVAVATGRVVPIEAVPDPAFSERMLGDGIAVEPEDPVITAPCAGRVEQVHRAHHAYGIVAPGGARVLVHVGIETVGLKGEGFQPRVKVGEEVRAGQPLVEFEPATLQRHGVKALTILVVENSDEHPVSWRAGGGSAVQHGADVVLRLDGDGAPPLQRPPPEPGASPGRPRSDGHETAAGRATVRHHAGLHARPAARVAAAVRGFRGDVEVLARGQSANARSVVALMGLGVDEGEVVDVVATGQDATQARDAVIAALETPEPREAAPATRPAAPAAPAAPAPTLDACDLAGVVASRGLAVGRTHHLRLSAPEVAEEGKGAAVELPELQRALREAAADVDAELAQARARRSAEEAGIFEAHRALVEDPELFYRASALVAAGKGAAAAWSLAVREQCAALERTGSALLAERTADLRDVERRVVQRLTGAAAPAPALPEQAILLAEDLTPGELAALDRSRLAGIVLHRGGPTSHVAIVARSQGIPALVAAGPGLRMVPDGAEAVLDARAGVLCWRPTPARLAAVRAELAQAEAARVEARAAAGQPAVTTDGVRLEVAANVGNVEEADRAAAAGADGVGLLRTELVFVERTAAPTVEEQRAIYQRVLDAFPGGGTVILRTLDVGADKSLAYVPQPREDNPALGLRGVRLGLARKELLAEQLRACLALRPLSRLRIMLPMVTDGEDVLQAREILALLAAEQGVAPPPLGVMVETPAAAVLADQLAAHADFFSIGTNDLTQYTLAMDRANPSMASRLDDLHPAVLRMVARIVEGAAVHGRWVGVCGAMASDPIGAALLVGLGVSELSVSVATLAQVKQLVRRIDRRACAELARRALDLGSGPAVRAHVRQALPWVDAPG
jgi:phosphoenolpyruvate-protein phosphotransferase